MLYKSIKSVDFLPEKDFAENYKNLQKVIDKHMVSGYIKSFDGLKLYYEYFLCENAVGNLVIVHGLSEFTKKFHEIALFFLNQNYNVFIFDQRGHGYSGRETDDLQALFIKSYNDYEKDLDCFIKNVVEKVSSLPITLFSQSMGGAVATLYLQNNPTKIEKAIFSAPMVFPNTNGAPSFLIFIVAKALSLLKGKDKPFLKSEPFSKKSQYCDSSTLCQGRFDLYLNMRVNDEFYQTSTITNSWMAQTALVKRKLLRKRKLNKIETKCLILSAENDNVVLEKPQRLLSKRLKNSEFVTIKDAKHTIYASNDKIMQEYFNAIRKFLRLPTV